MRTRTVREISNHVWNQVEVMVMAEQKVLIDLPYRPIEETVEGRPEVELRPRLKVVNRNQLLMRSVDVEKLIEPDHAARGIWALVERLDMRPFENSIKAVEGHAEQSTVDPRVLVPLWT